MSMQLLALHPLQGNTIVSTATPAVATTQLPLTALPHPAHPMMAGTVVLPTLLPLRMVPDHALPHPAANLMTDAPIKVPVTALYPSAATSIRFGALHQPEGYCIFTTTPAADGKKMRCETRNLLKLFATCARQAYT
jgi:hypothetical protein